MIDRRLRGPVSLGWRRGRRVSRGNGHQRAFRPEPLEQENQEKDYMSRQDGENGDLKSFAAAALRNGHEGNRRHKWIGSFHKILQVSRIDSANGGGKTEKRISPAKPRIFRGI